MLLMLSYLDLIMSSKAMMPLPSVPEDTELNLGQKSLPVVSFVLLETLHETHDIHRSKKACKHMVEFPSIMYRFFNRI